MKNINNLQKVLFAVIAGAAFCITSCDPSIEALKYDLPEANSIPDATPPQASFSASVTSDYLTYAFSNTSISATDYAWDFGDGNTSTEREGMNTFPSEGTYTVTLRASDKLNVVSEFTQTIEVVEPDEPPAIVPALVNADFNKIPKSSGSDCACSGWINKKIGDQGESSSGNGGSDNVVKFDNNEPDAIYQEFAITPNADYSIEIVTQFKPLTSGGVYPSKLELRVLAGSGYDDGYTPTYYTDASLMPQGNSDTGYWGYNSVAQVEDEANNLMVKVQENPNDDGYLTYTYTFNTGNNDSVALFVRGIGGPATGGGGSDLGYNSGDEEIRADYVTITPVE
ncbi:PKD domain-containing protein [Cognatitamlana onchidii]|uniref:PKD domain-containing protein n=1 Tax=Cognatitamlana onchidii TaxID=2562860 RepID=UPI0010A60E6A|nr:PKD domain-containing protein [Algibacter onchidii]